MPVHQEYTREILATKLEQILWHLDQVERIVLPRTIIEAPRMAKGGQKRKAHGAALRSGSGALAGNLPKPLVPASLMIQLVTTCAATGSLLLDCRGMTPDEMMAVWRNFPKDVVKRGVTPVFIADRLAHDSMTREGATVEYLYPSPLSGSEGWDGFVSEKLDFLRRKYGVERIMGGQAFLPRTSRAG